MNGTDAPVLVTGANGFIGSNLCRHLLEDGLSVKGWVRPTSDLSFIQDLTGQGLELITGQLSDEALLKSALKGVSTLYHVAGLASDWGSWEFFRSTNVHAVRNLMNRALRAGVKRVVHVSSVSVYGFPGKCDVTETEPLLPRPEDPYITTKTEGENLALSFNTRGIEVCVIRPGGVYGPNDRTTTLQMGPVLEAGKFAYVDGGRHIMAPLYIDNLVQAMRLAAVAPKAVGEIYNVGDEGHTSWREYIGWMCEDLGCRSPRLSVPGRLAWALATGIEGVAKNIGMKESPVINKYRVRAVRADSHYSIEKARNELGYHPAISTREGIRRTINWYRTYQQEGKAA